MNASTVWPAERLEGIADRKAFVDETLQRIENAIDPDQRRVQQVTRQDMPDSDHLRLTPEQANALLAAPGLNDRRGIVAEFVTHKKAHAEARAWWQPHDQPMI